MDRQPIVGADTDAFIYNAKYGVRGLTIVAYSADGFTKTQIETPKNIYFQQFGLMPIKKSKLTYYDTGLCQYKSLGVTLRIIFKQGS